jgi:hypothetical protein
MTRHGSQSSASVHRQCLIQGIFMAPKIMKAPILDIGISDANREKNCQRPFGLAYYFDYRLFHKSDNTETFSAY